MKLLFLYIVIICSVTFLSFQIKVKTTDDLLANPFNLQKFKKTKGESNSGGALKRKYYFKPDTAGVYISFSCFKGSKGYIGEKPGMEVSLKNGIDIITYKPSGKYQNLYLDPTETLIEVIERFNDYDLPDLAFVGLDTLTIKKRLGESFYRKDSCFVYAKGKNAITLKISHKTVIWLKYTRLKFVLTNDNIPSDMLLDDNGGS